MSSVDLSFWLALAALLIAVWAVVIVYSDRKRREACVHNHAMRLHDLETRHNYHTKQIAECEVVRDLHSEDLARLNARVVILEGEIDHHAKTLFTPDHVVCGGSKHLDLTHDVKYLDERIANLESYANLLSQAPAVQCDVPPWSVPVLRTPSGPKPEVRNVERRDE